MKIYLLISTILISSLSFAQTEIGGIELPNTIKIESDKADISGAGIRKKLWIKLYAIGLYHNESTTSADKIIQSKKPMGIKIQILSRFISSQKLIAATQKGFEKSTHKHTKSIRTKIEYFLSLLEDPLTSGDVYDIQYHLNTGVRVYKNEELKGIIKGTKFKQALYGIWIGDQPVSDKLRDAMLGENSSLQVSK